MIDHIIKHQIVIIRQFLHIAPVSERLIHLVIIHRCKPTVTGGRKERQDMNAAHRVLKVTVKHLIEIF